MVYLIGAGPGDPELMTLKAARALGRADVILVDALVSRDCLSHARPGARVIDVGKRCGRRSASQAFIQRLIARYARRGCVVARLKGGDPFVFGRGGEEAGRLRMLGLQVEVIPGLTAGTAVPAMLGIPVTHRDLTHGVTFLTGHGVEHDWKALVQSDTTLVIYMGSRHCRRIAEALICAGMPAETPACAIENGTSPSQRARVSILREISTEGFTGPVLIVIGDVVRYAREAHGEPQARAA